MGKYYFESEYARQLSPPGTSIHFSGAHPASCGMRAPMGRIYLIPPPLVRPMSFCGALFEPLMELALLPPAAALPPVGSTGPGARTDRCM